MRLAACAAPALLLLACDTAQKTRSERPALTAAHDEGEAHPALERPAAATATSLGAEARALVTTLRVSAHIGSVIARKQAETWTIAGPQGCTVAAERIERAFDNLGALTAESSDERPSSFELQVGVLIGEERVLHFDMAYRRDGQDLVQLGDGTRFWIRGFDRDLWSADPRAWCPSEN